MARPKRRAGLRALGVAVLAAALACAFFACSLGATGCAASARPDDADTDQAVADEPGPIRVLADDILVAQAGTIAEVTSRYADAYGTEPFAPIEYAPSGEIGARLDEAAEAGESFDLVWALEEVVDALRDDGYVGRNTDDGGTRNYALADVLSYVHLALIRPAGGSADLPPTDLLDGSGDRMPKLPSFEGTVAVASDRTWQGRSANKQLYLYGFYSEEGGAGGAYSDEVRDKIVVFDDAEAVAAAVARGECDLGMVYNVDLSLAQGVEQCRDLGHGCCPSYRTGVVRTSARKTATRDFVEWFIWLV